MLHAVDLRTVDHEGEAHLDDDPPTRIRWHGPTWEPAVVDYASAKDEEDDPQTRIFDVALELVPRPTRRVELGGLIVVVEAGPELQASARRAAEKLHLASIEIDLDAVAEFASLWRPVALLVPERHYRALIGRLGERGLVAPILRVSREATLRPDLAARLSEMLVEKTAPSTAPTP